MLKKLFLLTILLLPQHTFAYLKNSRVLSFANSHTGEIVTATYFENGQYLEDGLKKINYILRDHRTGETYPMSKDLLDLLYDLKLALKIDEPFIVISGYRSPKTNMMLCKVSGKVAKRSLHMQGMAIDIRLKSKSIKQIRDAAFTLRRGGVGYYPGNNFVHVDVGRTRSW